eukprot:TRINITY_DN22286_c0_g1_i2.p1 TRINITY_DN22286_c0_g1~~TRINITY_DN22286_c0_g1_i2.p1  ORF type:complete len:395 (+),score=57.65 TRINITY_DN22286_c0_g1_i2:25-1185(+)
MVKYSREAANPSKACKAKGVDLRVHYTTSVNGSFDDSCSQSNGSTDARRLLTFQPDACSSVHRNSRTPLTNELRRFHNVLRAEERATTQRLLGGCLDDRVNLQVDRVQSLIETVVKQQRRMHLDCSRRLKSIKAEDMKRNEVQQERMLLLEETRLEKTLRLEDSLSVELQQLNAERAEVHAQRCRLSAENTHGSECFSASSSTITAPSAEQTYSGSSTSSTYPAITRPCESIVDTSIDVSSPTALPSVYADAITLIEEHGWDVLHGGEQAGPAWTVLHWAALHGRCDVCMRLLAAAADPELVDERGRSAIDYAVARGNLEAAAILCTARRPIDASSHLEVPDKHCATTRCAHKQLPCMIPSGRDVTTGRNEVDAWKRHAMIGEQCV